MKERVFNERIAWIDNIKGLAILLVMWGHVQVVKSGVYHWINSFHVQIFLILSGYLFAKQHKDKHDLMNIIRKVSFPYVSFSIIAIFINIIWNLLLGNNVKKNCLLDCYKVISLYGTHSMWYLPRYLIASILFITLVGKSKKIQKCLLVLGGLLLSINGSYLLSWADNKLSYTLYEIIYYPAASIIGTFACMFFIGIGYITFELHFLEKFKGVIAILIGIILLVGAYRLCLVTGDCNFSTVKYGNTPVLFMCSGLFGALGTIIINYQYKNSIKILEYYGKNSLILLITHSTLKFTNISQKVVGLVLSPSSCLFGFICLLLIMLIEIVVVYLLNNQFGFLICFSTTKNK